MSTMSPQEMHNTDVADISGEGASQERPAQVALALKLAIIGLALGALAASLSWRQLGSFVITPRLVATQALTLVLVAWVYYNIYVGRNWARILLLAVAITGPFIYLNDAMRTMLLEAPAIAKVSHVVNACISIAVLYLLFTRPGSTWFKRQRRAPAA
jgi:hypothetical protein